MAGPLTEESEAVRVAHELDSKERTDDVIWMQDLPSHTTSLSFADMGLSIEVLKGLHAAGFQRPSPVQVKAIPLGCLGVDLIVQAKSGTGKTVVFAVLTLEAIDTKRKDVQAIVISPTREIAFQSASVIRQLGHFVSGLRVQLFVGGISLSEDIKHVEHCHVAVGTPGRLKYLINAGHINCENIRLLILDEADLLFSGGAGPDTTDAELLAGKNTFPAAINYIWWALPESKQVLALSATYTEHLVKNHLPRYLRSPALVRFSAEDPSLLGVRQFFHKVSSKSASPAAVFRSKVKELLRIIKEIDFKQCLVFSNFHNSAEQLCESLRSSGWPVTYISSGLDQKERFKAFNSLRNFQCRILVSTDLTSRGIDAENVNLVINLEVPWHRDIYLHRIGRAGRFGSYGASILLVSDTAEEMKLLAKIGDPDFTPIRQLPDPIPVDLATAECLVDLSKLVTVTKLSCELQSSPLNSDRSKDVIKHVTKCPSVRKGTSRACIVRRDRNPVAKGSNLKENLKVYTNAMLSKSLVRAYLATDGNIPEAIETAELSSDLETSILRELSLILEGHSTSSPAWEAERRRKIRLSVAEEEEEKDEREAPSGRSFKLPNPKESEVYKRNQEIASAGAITSNEQQPLSLSPRQLVLWTEYCRLVGWKDYFHQAWWNATQEYEMALLEYTELTNQMRQLN